MPGLVLVGFVLVFVFAPGFVFGLDFALGLIFVLGLGGGFIPGFAFGFGFVLGLGGGFAPGFVFGFLAITADLNYQQGIDRMWTRSTRLDHYWPALAHLGEQAVLSKEIYADGSDDDETVFGYNERWCEYRYKPSKITGILNSKASQSLDMWHLAQNFGNRPVLNAEFIQSDTPLDRVRALNDGETTPPFLLDCYNDLKCSRPLPVRSVPGLIDHF